MTPNQLNSGKRSHRGPQDEGDAPVPRPESADDADDLDAYEDELLAAALLAQDSLGDDMLVGTPRELEALDDETAVDPVADARARLTVAQLLERLVHHADEVALRDLFVLSDLSRTEADAVEAQWPAIPVERRRRLVQGLLESAEEHVELLLGRLLRIAIRDSDPAVRAAAVAGLWEDDDPALIGPLVQLLQHDPNVAVRAAAAEALGAFVLAGELDELDAARAMRAEQALLAVLNAKTEPVAVQAKALESVAYSSEAGLRQLIEDAYYASDEALRLSALRAMGRSADAHWRSMARAELSSPEPAMRAEAARACGELEARQATPQILALLDDPEQAVRLAAIDALGHLGGKTAREALRAVADEGEEAEAAAAEIALDELLFFDEPGAVPLLDESDDDEDDADDDAEVEPWRRARDEDA